MSAGLSLSSTKLNMANNNDTQSNVDLNQSSSNISNSNNNNASSNSSSSNENNVNNQSSNANDDVCRDYLRNVCRRGKNCRYKHPDNSEIDSIKNKEPYVFCHDFQNRECRRDNCKFLHCTKQEEEIYKTTGKLPPSVLNQLHDSSIPVCKDFLNGTCRRGHRCKYRHPMPESPYNYGSSLNNGPYDSRNGRGSTSGYSMNNSPHNMDSYPPSHGPMGYGPPPSVRSGPGASGGNLMPSNYGGYNDYQDTPPHKRKRYDQGYDDSPYPGAYNEPPPIPPMQRNANYNTPHQSYGATGQYGQQQRGPQPIDQSRPYLEEENSALRRRVDELKKQVSDLISANEYLAEQLNQMRASNTAVALTSACGPTHTSVASLQPQAAPGAATSGTAAVGMSAPLALQPPPQATAVAIGPLPPVSIVSSIASISLPTVTAPVTLVNSSAAAAYTPSMHSSNPWPLGVDQ